MYIIYAKFALNSRGGHSPARQYFPGLCLLAVEALLHFHWKNLISDQRAEMFRLWVASPAHPPNRPLPSAGDPTEPYTGIIKCANMSEPELDLYSSVAKCKSPCHPVFPPPSHPQGHFRHLSSGSGDNKIYAEFIRKGAREPNADEFSIPKPKWKFIDFQWTPFSLALSLLFFLSSAHIIFRYISNEAIRFRKGDQRIIY